MSSYTLWGRMTGRITKRTFSTAHHVTLAVWAGSISRIPTVIGTIVDSASPGIQHLILDAMAAAESSDADYWRILDVDGIHHTTFAAADHCR